MKQSLSQKELLGKATRRYAENISLADDYLKSRGITREVARLARFGVVGEPEVGHEAFVGRLSIPYITKTGVVDLRFRSLNPAVEPKYMGMTGAETKMYNVLDIEKAGDWIAVCEGELDTIIASAILGVPAVGVPGVQAWKAHFNRMFTGYGRVYVIGDNDLKDDGTNPGAEFSRMVAQEIGNATIVSLPAGMDLNDLYLAKGIEETKRTIGVPNV